MTDFIVTSFAFVCFGEFFTIIPKALMLDKKAFLSVSTLTRLKGVLLG